MSGVGTVDQRDGPHPAAGPVDRLFHPFAGHFAIRLYIPHPLHARARPSCHAIQPHALVFTDFTRHRGPRCRRHHSVAIHLGPDVPVPGLHHIGSGQISQNIEIGFAS